MLVRPGICDAALKIKKNISERKIFHKTLTSIESNTNTLSRMLGKLFSQAGLHIFNRVTERQTTRLIIFILHLETDKLSAILY